MNCMRNLKLLLIGLFLLSSFWVEPARAEDGGVNFKVNVLERKATDTINDFIWNGKVSSPSPLKAVKGASTVNPDVIKESSSSKSVPKTVKKPNNYLLFLSPIYAVYYLVTVYL